MADVAAVKAELVSLSNEPALRSRRRMLKELAENLNGNDAHVWARLDLPLVFPDDAVADPRLDAAIEDLGRLELLRNLSILLPLLVTWFGIASATHAYGQLLAKDPSAATQPFVQLWQQGFQGEASWWVPTFTQVGVADIIAISLVIGLSYFVGVFRKRIDVTYARTETEIRGRLNQAVTESSVILAGAALDSPSRFSEALTVAAEKLADADTAIASTADRVSEMVAQASSTLQMLEAAADKLVATHVGYAAATSDVAVGLAKIGPRLDGARADIQDLVAGQREIGDSLRGGLDGLSSAASDLGGASAAQVGRAADLSEKLARERDAFAAAEGALVHASEKLTAVLPALEQSDARVAEALQRAAGSAGDMAQAANDVRGVSSSLATSISGPLERLPDRLDAVVQALDRAVDRLGELDFTAGAPGAAQVTEARGPFSRLFRRRARS